MELIKLDLGIFGMFTNLSSWAKRRISRC